MAIRSADQISIVDLTDGYSVTLTSDGYTFPGTTSAAKAGSCTTQIIALRGSEQVAATVDLNSITKPTGITVTKDSNATSPTLTITASTSFTTAGVVRIPVVVDGDITITKDFSVAIAFTGATGGQGPQGETGATGKGVASVAITYQGSSSNTTAPTGTWQSSPPSVTQGQYLWTRLIFTYTDNTTSDPVYSVAKQGSTGGTGAAGGRWYSGTGIGHGVCHIICETSVRLPEKEVYRTVRRIAGDVYVDLRQLPQDAQLAENQSRGLRCGDNGIFRGMPVTAEQKKLSRIARRIYEQFPYDGKYILDGDRLIICQSNARSRDLQRMFHSAEINPLGDWTGGTDVDTGAVNRKLGSDMGDSVTGGGLHGKDLSKADVSVNIYAWLKAQLIQEPVEISCAIGDEIVDGLPYEMIVRIARRYIEHVGGFEKFAEWGLIR